MKQFIVEIAEVQQIRMIADTPDDVRAQLIEYAAQREKMGRPFRLLSIMEFDQNEEAEPNKETIDEPEPDRA